MLHLMYITNNPSLAVVAEEAGVDMIVVDLEILGKASRQGHLNTVISCHTLDDVAKIRTVLTSALLLVRINPMHVNSRSEIEQVIRHGADIIMLPMFCTPEEAERFIAIVAGRAQTCLLVETPGAVANLEAILALPGIDSIHIGLNDLHLAYGMRFMFELLADGTVERLGQTIQSRGIPWGFGGIAHIGRGLLPAEYIITEHHRLGSCQAILSRSFYMPRQGDTIGHMREAFLSGIGDIRDFEAQLKANGSEEFARNTQEVQRIVSEQVLVGLAMA